MCRQMKGPAKFPSNASSVSLILGTSGSVPTLIFGLGGNPCPRVWAQPVDGRNNLFMTTLLVVGVLR